MSISRRLRSGDAPSVAATSRNAGSIERSAGVTMRTTNGAAMSDWATGTSHHDDRKSSGASSKAIRNPKPSITAEAPRGSSTKPSTTPAGRRASAIAASPPTTSAIAAATPAKTTENTAASHGSTRRAGVASKSAPQLPRDRSSSDDEREEERERAGPEHADDGDALPPVRPAKHVVLVGERAPLADPRLEDAGHREHHRHGSELQQRQRGRCLQVEQPRGLVVDLRLHGRPARTAENQDHAERREAEQERQRRAAESAGAS